MAVCLSLRYSTSWYVADKVDVIASPAQRMEVWVSACTIFYWCNCTQWVDMLMSLCTNTSMYSNTLAFSSLSAIVQGPMIFVHLVVMYYLTFKIRSVASLFWMNERYWFYCWVYMGSEMATCYHTPFKVCKLTNWSNHYDTLQGIPSDPENRWFVDCLENNWLPTMWDSLVAVNVLQNHTHNFATIQCYCRYNVCFSSTH